LSDGDAAVEAEGADLVDNRGALADETGAHPVQGLQVELFGRLGGDKAHGCALDGLGDGFGVAEVVLVALGERFHSLAGMSLASWPKALRRWLVLGSCP
jgi:hypothetical protein